MRFEKACGLLACTMTVTLMLPSLFLGGCGNGNDSPVGIGGATGTGTGGSSSGVGGTSNGVGGGSVGTGGSTMGTGGGSGTGTGGVTPGGSGGRTGTGGSTTGTGGGSGTGTGGVTPGGSGGRTGTGGSTGAGGGASSCPVISDFATWPTGKAPLDVGKLAANDFKGHTGDSYGGAGYALIFSWFGALRFTKITGDTTNNMYLITQFEPYATGSVTVDNSATATVDSRAFGDLPLEIWQQNMDARCKTLGLARADMQWAATDANGITKDARYWADDMFMITGLQVEAYRVTKDSKYLDRAAKTMQSYFTALQQADGMFWHTQTSKAYWGRANGWVASGMTELLLELPAGTVRDAIMAGYKKQMDGILGVQVSGGTDDGMWRQVLDLNTAPVESSCTAMFTYALVNGVRNGWLTDPKYSAAARRGWLAVANKTNTAGKLDKVCPGTGAAPAGTLASQQMFYDTITFGLGDLHGQAPLLWAASAFLRPDCPGVR